MGALLDGTNWTRAPDGLVLLRISGIARKRGTRGSTYVFDHIGRIGHATVPGQTESEPAQPAVVARAQRHDDTSVTALLDCLARVVVGDPSCGRLEVEPDESVVVRRCEQPGVQRTLA